MATKIQTNANTAFVKNIETVNCKINKATDSIIDSTIETAESYQKIMAKAVKNSEPLIEKQIDIVFNALKTIKVQYQKGRKQFSSLIGKEMEEAVKSATKAAKNATAEASKKATAISKEATATAKKVNKTVSNAAKSVTQDIKKAADKVVDITDASDDLKKISGIGPKVAELLNAAGINDFATLANTSVDQLKSILEKAGSRYALVDATLWPAQAAELKK